MEKSHTSLNKTPRAERVRTALPVHLDGQRGSTRDVSLSGVYLEMPEGRCVGDELSFVIEYESNGRQIHMHLIGEVVRVERGDGRIGMAVQIKQQNDVTNSK